MALASERKTTRLEDQAYCLIGLFDVSLPLIYGEGDKAFRRLQEEIIYRSVDHSIFAWQGRSPPYYEDPSYEYLLAKSPQDARHARHEHVVPLSGNIRAWGGAYSVDNLRLRLPLVLVDCRSMYDTSHGGAVQRRLSHAIPNCRYQSDPSPLAINLFWLDDGEDIDLERRSTTYL